MMTELMLVEGASDIVLISCYLQKKYGWKYERENILGINKLDEHDHIESLSKEGNQLVLCGVGGKERLGYFLQQHCINNLIVEREVSSIMVVTDRDEDTISKIERTVNNSFDIIPFKVGEWIKNTIVDSFGQQKQIYTYLLIIPMDKEGALENVIINALKDIPEEKELIQEVEQFVDTLKEELVPDLKKHNKADKAEVGTFFSVRYPQNAMRSFGIFISKIDWPRSGSLNEIFLPFSCLGQNKK